MKSFLLKSFVLTAAGMSLMACELDGNLTANQNLQLTSRKGRPILLQANRTYKASIEKDDNVLELDIKVNGDEMKVRIRPPAGQSVPSQEGEMFVTAAQAGQPVDFHGIVNTDVDRGMDQRGSRSCTEQVQVAVYSQVLRTRPDGSSYYDNVCSYQYQTQYGSQDINYYNQTTTTTGELRLLNPGTQDEAAKFYGQSSKSEQIVTWSGMCRVNGGGGRCDNGGGGDHGGGGWGPGRDDRDHGGGRGGGRRGGGRGGRDNGDVQGDIRIHF